MYVYIRRDSERDSIRVRIAHKHAPGGGAAGGGRGGGARGDLLESSPAACCGVLSALVVNIHKAPECNFTNKNEAAEFKRVSVSAFASIF